MFLFCSTAGFVYIVCWTKPALSQFSNALKITFIHSFISSSLYNSYYNPITIVSQTTDLSIYVILNFLSWSYAGGCYTEDHGVWWLLFVEHLINRLTYLLTLILTYCDTAMLYFHAEGFRWAIMKVGHHYWPPDEWTGSANWSKYVSVRTSSQQW